MDADEVIERLGLEPHPEGGHYRQTFRAPPFGDEGQPRGASTAIYYLLRAGEVGRWHRVDADEVWHFYAGAALELALSDGKSLHHVRLGRDLAIGERPQAVVPREVWQSARSLGRWTLVGCTVAPAFEFSHFELAPEGWRPC